MVVVRSGVKDPKFSKPCKNFPKMLKFGKKVSLLLKRSSEGKELVGRALSATDGGFFLG